jgi:folate-binding protein YgfZ
MTIDIEVAALRSAAGIALRSERRVIAVEGPDRARFLNGMLTNDVAKLAEGQGLWALKTSAKGRIEAYVRVRAGRDKLYIDAIETVFQKLYETLDRHILMDDVTLSIPELEAITVLGPKANEALGDPLPLEDHAFVERDGSTIIRDVSFGLRGYEIHVKRGEGASLLERSSATRVSSEALEVVRVESGVPIDGRDLGEDTLPMEAALDHAISYSKGCYVGQEVIARGTYLGGVHYTFVGLRFLEETHGAEGAKLFAEGKAVGEITSVVRSPTLGAWIGLGYVRKGHESPKTKLSFGDGAVVVEELPFL